MASMYEPIFLLPRRFAEVWQMSSDFPGTNSQQQIVRGTFHLSFDSLRHRLMKRLDESANQKYNRSYLIVGFLPDDMFPPDWLAVAGVSGISLRASFALDAIKGMLEHELGHVVDKHLLTAETKLAYMLLKGIDPNINTWNRNVQEMWADDFAIWFRTDGKSMSELTPLLV